MAKSHKSGKIQVIDKHDQSKVPFLRGIMTRSLQDAGMEFDDAYALASEIRDALLEDGEVLSSDLRKIVETKLKHGHSEHLAAYQMHRGHPVPLMIRDRDDVVSPFSKNLLAQSLELCSMDIEDSYTATAQIERELLMTGKAEWSSQELAEFTYRHLLAKQGKKTAKRYGVWVEFSRSGRPLILLIGGTTGCGKSTISSEVAHRLNIVRTQSTDMLREVMRLLVPERLLPTLHKSSFNAWQSLPLRSVREENLDENLIDGYLSQSSQVGIGIEAVVQRAHRERISLIIEGVHIRPNVIESALGMEDAIIVPCIIAVLKKKTLRNRLKGRGQLVSTRRAERYIKYFDAIWLLQSFLLDESDRFAVPIVSNDDRQTAVREVMEIIAERLEVEFKDVGSMPGSVAKS